MKTDKGLSKDILRTEQGAKEIEDAGYDGLWVGETKHDPFMQCLLAAKATSRVNVVTSVAIAFARTPMLLANLGCDLALYGQGRSILGLGSQVKPHIEQHFSMPWSRPATRMRELILATRAIWDAWQNDGKLDFQGDFYTHTLMSPFFSPTPHAYGPPPIYLAGVNELMTEVAGETCDGFFIHAFSTRRYIDEVTLPALRRGRAKAGSPSMVSTSPRRRSALSVATRRSWPPRAGASRTRSPSTRQPRPTGGCWSCTAGGTCSRS